jgi:hypothetical protein
MSNTLKILVRKPEESGLFERPSHRCEDIIKILKNKYGLECGPDSYEPVVSCCEYFKDPLHSIKGRSFLVS